jgi:ligand-binding SRPBCC domain-containing protein
MPQFEAEVILPRPVAEVFDFFCRPANLVRLSPPELNMQLLEAPERLGLGSRIVLKTRRWGIPQRMAAEITVFEPGVRFVDEQREGPFRRWVHGHHFETVPDGTRVTDRIEYEPPGGVLGLLLTGRLIERELKGMFDYRQQKLRELLGREGGG